MAKKQNNKRWLWIVIAVLVLLFLFSCARMARHAPGPNDERNGKTASPVAANTVPATNPGTTKQLALIFDYRKVKQYDYRSTTYVGNMSLVSHYRQRVDSEEREGVDAWHVVTTLELDGVQPNADIYGYTEAWFDKATQKCVDAQNVLMNHGKATLTDVPCGPTMVTGNPLNPWLPFLRSSEITLPLGTFAVDMYGLEGAAIYFMNKDIGVPVMMTWGKGTPGPGTIYFELESYS